MADEQGDRSILNIPEAGASGMIQQPGNLVNLTGALEPGDPLRIINKHAAEGRMFIAPEPEPEPDPVREFMRHTAVALTAICKLLGSLDVQTAISNDAVKMHLNAAYEDIAKSVVAIDAQLEETK